MHLEPALRLSSILLAAVGFCGLAITGELPFGLILLGSWAIVVSLVQLRRGHAQWLFFRISPMVWNFLILVAFVFFAIDLFWISQDILQANVHFLVVLMVNKLLTLRYRKDFLQLYVISLLELLASAAMTVELGYGAVFLAYLLVATWTMLLYHLRTEAGQQEASGEAREQWLGSPSAPGGSGPITGSFFWTTNGIAVSAFCLTVVIFFLIPRIGVGFLHNNRMNFIRTAGFSERVNLGVIGAIKLDPTIVMRVEFPDIKGPIPDRMYAERLYLRGMAYDLYDGRSWANSFRRHSLDRWPSGDFRIASSRTAGLRQDIMIEALDTTVLFGVSFVHSIRGNFNTIQVDAMGGLSLPDRSASRFQYTAFSTLSRLREDERVATGLAYPKNIKEDYLGLPRSSQRMADLARAATTGATTAYERAALLERFLRDSYRYSLDVGTDNSENPVEEFLFVRKTGYCEHYASAMVLMLRTLGIPARLVTGFLIGEWNDFGGYYTVRQQDAHAWVEVFFPQSGWIVFDPTPNIAAAPPNPLLAMAGRIVDSVRLRWYRYVIQYSLGDQVRLAQGVRERGDTFRAQVVEWFASVGRMTASIRAAVDRALSRVPFHAGAPAVPKLPPGMSWVPVVVVVLLTMLLVWRRLTRRSVMVLSGRQQAAVRLYVRMLKLLETRGLRKAPAMTPMEFAGLVSDQWSVAGRCVRGVTDLYCRVRFGQAPLSQEELQSAESLLASLRAARR
jgi:hypothetical protein